MGVMEWPSKLVPIVFLFPLLELDGDKKGLLFSAMNHTLSVIAVDKLTADSFCIPSSLILGWNCTKAMYFRILVVCTKYVNSIGNQRASMNIWKRTTQGGYVYNGHSKAALQNQYFARRYQVMEQTINLNEDNWTQWTNLTPATTCQLSPKTWCMRNIKS